MDGTNRHALLSAIARAIAWVDSARAKSEPNFAAIAARENPSERYIRLLAPLAFLSPRIIEAIANGQIPVDLTATGLARNPPLARAEQERRFGLI